MQPTRGELIGRRSLRLAYWTWLPDEAPRATAALVHGIGEHTGRYVHVAEALAQRGYAVYGVDHRGHGASEGARAYVDRFDDFVEDLHLVLLEAKRAHAGLSAFMLGHSMGGLIALRYALQHQEELAGLVLSGVALQFGESVSPLVRRSARVIAALAPRLPISRGYARGESVLSRDPAVQARFDADPLCFHGRYCARTGFELLKAAADALARLEQLT